MLFLYLLIALTAVAAAIFATPLRRKVWTASRDGTTQVELK